MENEVKNIIHFEDNHKLDILKSNVALLRDNIQDCNSFDDIQEMVGESMAVCMLVACVANSCIRFQIQ